MQPQSQASPLPQPHKILITYRGLEGLLRGEHASATLVVKNIGDARFTGGKFTSVRLEFSVVSNSVSESNLQKIPALEPQAEAEFGYGFYLPTDGFGWVIAKIQADDGRPVEHYQNLGFATGAEWRNTIYVDRPEDRQIIGLLEKIVALLGRS